MQSKKKLLIFCGAVLLLIVAATAFIFLTQPSLYEGVELEIGQAPDGRYFADFFIYSESTGSPDGKLAVRAYIPEEGRHNGEAPIVITGAGGFDEGGMDNRLPEEGNDFVMITFMFPGGTDEYSGRASEGEYDYRGPDSMMALRDVILFASGELMATNGESLEQLINHPVNKDNIGLIGFSNGGNIIVAVAAEYGDEIRDHVKYLIQWETPVSSQAAVRDFGRIWLKPSNAQGEYFNPRYCGYGDEAACTDYSDLTYNPDEEFYPVFFDGNGDGVLTTVMDPETKKEVPDLDLSGTLETDEDWPLDTFEDENGLLYYSRPVTEALANMVDEWPRGVATVVQANAFWDLRESVVMYDAAIKAIPDLEAMVLCGARDHVQSSPDKFHVRQAYEGWLEAGTDWVKVNPSLEYVYMVDPRFEDRDLPDVNPNTPPGNWSFFPSYAMPENMNAAIYDLAALWQMMDRAEKR